MRTKGTWRICTDAIEPYWRGDGTEVLSDYGRIAVTHCDGLRDIVECRDNATLITAAPDLLAVCERILADDDTVELLSDETLAELKAAISKATI